MKLTETKQEALKQFRAEFGKRTVTRPEMLAMGKKLEKQGFTRADYNWLFRSEYRQAWGEYKIPTNAQLETDTGAAPKAQKKVAVVKNKEPEMRATMSAAFNPNAESEFGHSVVPDKDKHYVPFGEFKTIDAVVKSGKFFPVFISGHSGNGKTFMVEQVCARLKRPMVRVQVSRETDSDDLIGGFRLIEGETKFMKGPVLRAMEQGAILLIDEADRADPGKIMCLQGILEGKPYYVKKTGEVIRAADGFNVIVTANTKGKGSDDGRYVAAGILDDAWLERFPITIEQEYPPAKTESRILTGYMNVDHKETPEDTTFIANLISWADIIRKTFEEGGIDEIVSTRRLVHIVNTYKMFGFDRIRAINLCIARFDNETKDSFLDLYTKVDADVAPQTPDMNVKSEAPPSSPF